MAVLVASNAGAISSGEIAVELSISVSVYLRNRPRGTKILTGNVLFVLFVWPL
jgi:hypothetical protein